MSKWKDMHDEEVKAAQQEVQQPEFESLDEIETGFAEDMQELHQAFRDRAQKENKRFMDVTDTDYYFCVCFRSQEQMVEFCESVGIDPDQIYVDGKEFARKIGRAIKAHDPVLPRQQGGWKELRDIAMDK